MMKEKQYIYPLTFLLSLLLGACQDEVLMEPSQEMGHTISLELQLPKDALPEPTLVDLGEPSSRHRRGATPYAEDVELAVFIVQGIHFEYIGNVALVYLANGQKGISITFALPSYFDVDRPLTIVGYAGMNPAILNFGNRTSIKRMRNKLLVNVPSGSPYELGGIEPILVFRMNDVVIGHGQSGEDKVLNVWQDSYFMNTIWDGRQLVDNDHDDDGNEGIEVESVEFGRTNGSVDVDETLELEATVLPEDATDKTLVWTTTDSSVATVTQDGTVRGVRKGFVMITATAHNGVHAEAIIVIRERS